MTKSADLPVILAMPFLAVVSTFLCSMHSGPYREQSMFLCMFAFVCLMFLLIRYWRLLMEQPSLGVYVGFAILSISLPTRFVEVTPDAAEAMIFRAVGVIVITLFGIMVPLFDAGTRKFEQVEKDQMRK